MKLALCAALACVALASMASANDPSGSWLSYAAWTAADHARVTYVNTTWVVPNKPDTPRGSNAPGWWFGVQTAEGDGALIQPILAYGYLGSHYTIFNGVFDWTDESWHTSPEKLTVQPGDNIVSSVKYQAADNSYDMFIYSTNEKRGITTNYKILKEQTKNESTVYFVLEHQPDTCRAYPADGVCTFENIHVEVDGKAVTPDWEAKQEQPACKSECAVVDSKTLKFTWAASGAAARPAARPAWFPRKWQPAL